MFTDFLLNQLLSGIVPLLLNLLLSILTGGAG